MTPMVDAELSTTPELSTNLSLEDQMSLERAKELMIQYGRCINCGRFLKDARSVAQGLGPVCIKAFRS
jgi:hypothetical protein